MSLRKKLSTEVIGRAFMDSAFMDSAFMDSNADFDSSTRGSDQGRSSLTSLKGKFDNQSDSDATGGSGFDILMDDIDPSGLNDEFGSESDHENASENADQETLDTNSDSESGNASLAANLNDNQHENAAENEPQETLNANLALRFLDVVGNSPVGKFAKEHPVAAAVIVLTVAVVIGIAVVGATHGIALLPLVLLAAKAIKGAGLTAAVAIKGASVTTGTAIAGHAPASALGVADMLMSIGLFSAGVNAVRKKLFNDNEKTEGHSDLQPTASYS